MAEKQGIKELKELVVFVAALASAADKATQDGLGYEDAALFVPVLLKAPEAFQGLDKAKLELANLNQAEVAELNEALKQELDLVDDQLEGLVEKALSILVQLYGLIEAIKAKKSA